MLILEDITEQKQNTGKDESEEKVLALNTGENKVTTIMASSSRYNEIIVTSTATESQTIGGTEIKMKIETTIRLQEIPVSI